MKTYAWGQKNNNRCGRHPLLPMASIGRPYNSLVRQILRAPAFQAKLSVSHPGDVYEQEADRVAESVLRMPEEQLQRQPVEEEEEEELIQPKGASGGFDVSPELENSIRSQDGQGAPLPESCRAYFEPRLQADLRNVRVHAGPAAADLSRQVNARAFTLGSNVYFGPEEYAPNSGEGQKLLAHELVHVVQQHSAPCLRRKIATNGGLSLDSYFNGKGLSGVIDNGAGYSHAGCSIADLTKQILYDMLSSKRVFYVDGVTEGSAAASLDSHVEARKGIIDFADKKKYTFAAGSAMTMNPTYWQALGDVWQPKPGVDFMEAMKDVNVNPGKYKIACQAATKITMLAGSGDLNLVDDNGVAQSDWIPGDWGYITNTKFNDRPIAGREGENLIYVGAGKFWGHFSSGKTYQTLDEWFRQVEGWNKGARIETYRTRPSKGLV